MEESDYIFFAGDGIFGVTRTLENVADKLYAVGGNCDNSLYPEELVVDVEKVRFLIVHGHRFHDKLDLVYRAKGGRRRLRLFRAYSFVFRRNL